MDISGNIGSALPQSALPKIHQDVSLSVPGKASGSGVKKPEAKTETLPIPADVQEAENTRLDMLKNAADVKANFYPVGENAIAIYRNTISGEMIFRVRSLITGEVKEIPEQVLVEFIQQNQGGNLPGIELDA